MQKKQAEDKLYVEIAHKIYIYIQRFNFVCIFSIIGPANTVISFTISKYQYIFFKILDVVYGTKKAFTESNFHWPVSGLNKYSTVRYVGKGRMGVISPRTSSGTHLSW